MGEKPGVLGSLLLLAFQHAVEVLEPGLASLDILVRSKLLGVQPLLQSLGTVVEDASDIAVWKKIEREEGGPLLEHAAAAVGKDRVVGIHRDYIVNLGHERGGIFPRHDDSGR